MHGARGTVCLCVNVWLCIWRAHESVAILDTGLGDQVQAVPLLCMGHQISHFFPLGLNFLICELGIISLEGWASQNHWEALRAVCEQDKERRAAFVYLWPAPEHAELGVKGGGVGRKCLSHLTGEKQWALRNWLPLCEPCPRALRKSRSWKGSGEQGPTLDSPSEKFPSGEYSGHHQLGPWTLSQGLDEEVTLQLGDLGLYVGLHP